MEEGVSSKQLREAARGCVVARMCSWGDACVLDCWVCVYTT